MKPWIALLSLTLSFAPLATPSLEAHCQMPCGIYDDSLVFGDMKQCLATMAKAVAEISSHEMDSPAAINQMIRWVGKKDLHSDRFSEDVAEYFLKQRIPLDADNLDAKLKSAHILLVLSMRAKQTVDAQLIEDLKKEFERFYAMMTPQEPPKK